MAAGLAVAAGLPYAAAIRGLTLAPAQIWGVEGTTGSLEPGKVADLVILSADPTRVSPKALWDTRVLATIVDGRIEYCAKKVPTDLRKICP